MQDKDLEEFMESLFDIGCVKFGEFYLSSGLKTPVYFDLRLLVSHPKILKKASKLIARYIKEKNLDYDVICAVPYGACALATALGLELERPMVFKRKEAKDYGCKKMVEGLYNPDDKVLLIEDVVVYGTSIVETNEGLKDLKLQVKDAICLLDREQGGLENISDHQINFHRIIKASDLLKFLNIKNKITKETMNETLEFLKKHTFQACVHSETIETNGAKSHN